MENKDYIVRRKDIYIGEVLKAEGIYKRITSGIEKSGFLGIKRSTFYRNILFTPTIDRFASDLLYDTDDYPILNVTRSDYIFDQGDGVILINNYYSLDELLDYFCYDDDLSINDVVKLYNTFFTGKFSIDNCSLFGRKKVSIDEMFFNEYKRRKELYLRLDESVLDRYYFTLLQNNKRSFNPVKEEGKIKKLAKF